jgi:hypothetical protein
LRDEASQYSRPTSVLEAFPRLEKPLGSSNIASHYISSICTTYDSGLLPVQRHPLSVGSCMVKSLQLPTTEVDSKWELCRAKWYFKLYSLRQLQYSLQTLLPHFQFLCSRIACQRISNLERLSEKIREVTAPGGCSARTWALHKQVDYRRVLRIIE